MKRTHGTARGAACAGARAHASEHAIMSDGCDRRVDEHTGHERGARARGAGGRLDET